MQKHPRMVSTALTCTSMVLGNGYIVMVEAAQEGDGAMQPMPSADIWGKVWKAWVNNEAVKKDRAVGKAVAAAYAQVLAGHAEVARNFREDNCRPPRAVLSNFLATMDCKGERAALWTGAEAAREELYKTELQVFSQWFATTMVIRGFQCVRTFFCPSISDVKNLVGKIKGQCCVLQMWPCSLFIRQLRADVAVLNNIGLSVAKANWSRMTRKRFSRSMCPR